MQQAVVGGTTLTPHTNEDGSSTGAQILDRLPAFERDLSVQGLQAQAKRTAAWYDVLLTHDWPVRSQTQAEQTKLAMLAC